MSSAWLAFQLLLLAGPPGVAAVEPSLPVALLPVNSHNVHNFTPNDISFCKQPQCAILHFKSHCISATKNAKHYKRLRRRVLAEALCSSTVVLLTVHAKGKSLAASSIVLQNNVYA